MPPRSAFGGRGGWFGGAGPTCRPNDAICGFEGVGDLFLTPALFRESQPMRLVYHRDDATAGHGRVVVACM